MTNFSIEDKNRPAIICFAGCDWWYHNRGLFVTQIMKRLAKQRKVLFINSLGMRLPSLKSDRSALGKIFRKIKSMLRFVRKTDCGMYVFTPISLPLSGHRISDGLIIFFLLLQIKLVTKLLSLRQPTLYVGCPTAWEIARRLHHSCLIYQRTDIFEEMPGVNKSYISSLDDSLTRAADLVLYVNTTLWREGAKKNANSRLVGHGLDFELFATAEELECVPEDIAVIPKPIVGFFGDIDNHACDLALVEHIAKRLKNISIVLVGPISSDVSNLTKYDNVFFLGQKPYEEIPHYGKLFDVAIMPWKRNKWIEFCNPVKIKEYLALGKPIVSIDYPELKPYHDIVYAASDYDGFVSMIREALGENEHYLKTERQERVRNETWDKKVREIVEFIEKDLRDEDKI